MWVMKLKRFYFFFILTREHFFIAFREEGRERNIDAREKRRLIASHTCLDQGLYTPRLEIEPATFWLWNDAPTNWAIPARANSKDFK